MIWLLVGLLLGAGLIIGSFLNVVIARVPDGRSIVTPGSACPSCGTPIGWRDNIPLLSWVLLRARCRNCQARISVRYPLVELATGLLFVALGAWAFGSGEVELLPLLLVVGSAGMALFWIDVDHHRLPDVIVLPLAAVTFAGLLLTSLITPIDWSGVLIGAGIWLVVIGGLWLASGGRGMGFGDVKLAPTLGAVAGLSGAGAAAVGLLAAFLLGGLVGVALLASRRVGRRGHVPFGPFLLLGALIGLTAGNAVWSAYLTGIGL